MSGFHGAFATGVASQQGTLTPPDTWFRPPFGGLACALIVETRFPRLYTELMTVPNLTFTELRGFHVAFATGVASQQGALTLPDTWFRPPFWDLLMLQLLRPNSSNLPCLCSTFHLEYPLVLSRFYFTYTYTRRILSDVIFHAHCGHCKRYIAWWKFPDRKNTALN